MSACIGTCPIANTSLAQCEGMCDDAIDCTVIVHTNENGGSCSLKQRGSKMPDSTLETQSCARVPSVEGPQWDVIKKLEGAIYLQRFVCITCCPVHRYRLVGAWR